MPISVIMPGIRPRISRHAPIKNTQPPYQKITDPSTSGMYFDPAKVGACRPKNIMTISEKVTTGMVSTKLTQNLRKNILVECPACLSSEALAEEGLLFAFVGTSAIPHSGHMPGLSFCTSRCIGQVEIV